ncbi:MAG: dolichol-phosphate mannosyltransferase, partial [Cyanobacteria bacterium J06627_15]
MTQQTGHVRSRLWLPGLIFCMGVLFSLWLQRYSQGGVLFSGDGGLKALLAQQMGAGNLSLDLQLPAADWVQELWRSGLYPFTPPYAYEVGDQYFITFPFTFPAVTAPFYALLGYRGLYVVPLVSLWVIWGRFWYVCHQQRLTAGVTALALAGLVMASPLLPYGGMYWEHTLAVALAFWGLTMVLARSQTLTGNAIGGSLIGLAVWFRPEFLCLVAALGAVACLSLWIPLGGFRLKLSHLVALLVGMGLSVAVFFGINLAVYGHPLGIHSVQIVEESSVSQQIFQARDSYQQLLTALFRYFPLVILALAAPGVRRWLLSEGTSPRTTTVLLLTGVLFAIAVPLIVPPGAGGKQWGPRFYLILIPMAMLVIAQLLAQLCASSHKVTRGVGLAAFALLFAVGVHMNALNGVVRTYNDRQTQSISLARNYAPVAPAVQALSTEPLPWVAMSHQFVAQQLWASAPDKTFFRTETPEALYQLAQALIGQNESEFLYICYPHQDCPIPEQPSQALQFELENTSYQLVFAPAEQAGKYPFHQVSIQP